MAITIWDVIVVGAGPGGAIAAKVCADSGLDTLLIEKKRLPRDKVCSGMLMGSLAKALVHEHFGAIPKGVLIKQVHYNGITLHVGEKTIVEIPAFIPVGWRKDLDYWMCERAIEAGARLTDGARVGCIRGHSRGYELEIRQEDENKRLYTKYVIGADGSHSVVRRSLYPELKVIYRPAYRECYEEQLSIKKDHFHWFFPFVTPSPRFDINYKDNLLLIEGGSIREIRDRIRKLLADYGLPPDAKPLWRDGCVIPMLHNELLHDTFIPAKVNAVLVGDAAGMLFPFTHEGIGPALNSGVLAAQAVREALTGNGKAERHYIEKIQGMKGFLKELYSMHQDMDSISKRGADALGKLMREFIEKTLREGLCEV